MKNENFLNANNARHMWHPMAHPAQSLNDPPKIISEGFGVRIRDIEGRELVDAVGGLWNVNLGYSADVIKQAMMKQLEQLPYYSTFRGTSNEAVIELSYRLSEFFAPDGLTRAFLHLVAPTALKSRCGWPGSITRFAVKVGGQNS